jgi:hypothetical protein
MGPGSGTWRADIPCPLVECFRARKNETGPDHYQVRLYLAW